MTYLVMWMMKFLRTRKIRKKKASKNLKQQFLNLKVSFYSLIVIKLIDIENKNCNFQDEIFADLSDEEIYDLKSKSKPNSDSLFDDPLS